MKEIDARGLECPQPVILTKKALEEISEGEVVAIVDNVTARENVSRLALNMNLEHEITDKDGCFYIRIAKKPGAAGSKEAEESITIVVTSDKLGQGEEALGKVLIKSYTYALTEAAPLPKTMVFLNSGVKLTTEGSEVLENLQKLQDMGVEIMSCGTCLDFHGLKEKLKVGIVGNMYGIIEKMNGASKVININ